MYLYFYETKTKKILKSLFTMYNIIYLHIMYYIHGTYCKTVSEQ